MHCVLVLLLAALLSSIATASWFDLSTAIRSTPVRTQLEPVPLSAEEQKLLNELLPQSTVPTHFNLTTSTSQQPVAGRELRAPFHIPCQLRAFSHLPKFVSATERHELPKLEVKEFAQPPHVIFFDGDQEVVRTIVVAVVDRIRAS